MSESNEEGGVEPDEVPTNSTEKIADAEADDSALIGFAPDDPLDGRSVGHWQSRYPRAARRQIRNESIYLGVLLFLAPVLMLVLNTEVLKTSFQLTDEQYRPVLTFALAWLGGLLGGTLFDIKWFYHVVAREHWNQDRVYWRIFAPHISSGLAFATIALISSGLFRIFDPSTTKAKTLVIGISFLVGYFSDSAVAKLSEIAQTIFGASKDKEKHLDRMPPELASPDDRIKTKIDE